MTHSITRYFATANKYEPVHSLQHHSRLGSAHRYLYSKLTSDFANKLYYRFCNFWLCCCVSLCRNTQSSHKIYFVERQKKILIIITNGIIMENTALNDTTTTTTVTNDHQGWKTKKGYGPLIVAVSLALLLSFYAGRQVGGGTTTFRRGGAVGMTNGVASSSLLFVGSGTAASVSTTQSCTKGEDCSYRRGLLPTCDNGVCRCYTKSSLHPNTCL